MHHKVHLIISIIDIAIMDIMTRYFIQSDGTISNEGQGSYIKLSMSENNTLMIDELFIQNLSSEKTLKAILTAQTEFISGFVIPSFISELEVKDDSGVIERFSNMPGRSMERQKSTIPEIDRAIGSYGKTSSDAANIATEAANKAAKNSVENNAIPDK